MYLPCQFADADFFLVGFCFVFFLISKYPFLGTTKGEAAHSFQKNDISLGISITNTATAFHMQNQFSGNARTPK